MKANIGELPDYSDSSPLPVGKYHVSVLTAHLVESDMKAPYIKTVFVVREGQHEGRKIFKNFIFTQKALPFMKGFLVALNYDTTAEVNIDPKDWIDEELAVRVVHEMGTGEYAGKIKVEIAQYTTLKEAGFTVAGKLNDIDFPGPDAR